MARSNSPTVPNVLLALTACSLALVSVNAALPNALPVVLTPLCAPGMGCRCGAPLKLPGTMSPPDLRKAVNVTDQETGIWLPSILRFEALDQALTLIGSGLQIQRILNMDIRVSVTGMYFDLTGLEPFWVGKRVGQLGSDQNGFYYKLLDAPVNKAVVMVMNVGASVKAFKRSLAKSLNRQLEGSGMDVDAKVDQLLSYNPGARRIPKGTKILLMWRQPSDLLVSFITDDIPGFTQQTKDNPPMRNEPQLLRALFKGYLDETPSIPTLKRDIAFRLAAMK